LIFNLLQTFFVFFDLKLMFIILQPKLQDYEHRQTKQDLKELTLFDEF